ncbi:MAG: CPBP family intramembrane metalloprotease [Bacteroidales bacterium]|nr:CPBP family intramembrane metalloprotease [Bacteroidales bacterium]
MQLHNTQTPFWKKILGLLMIVAAMTVLGFVITVALYMLTESSLLTIAFSTIISIGGSAYFYWLFFDKKDFLKQTFLSMPNLRWILIAVGLLVLSLPAIESISVYTDYADKMLMFAKDKSLGGLLLMIFCIALLPAVFEEWMFRGILQRVLIQETDRVWLGVLIASAVFSAIHFDMSNFAARFLMGILLGLLYQYSGKLWVNIVFHFVNNALAALQFWFYSAEEIQNADYTFPVWIVLISFTVIALFVIWNEMKNERSVKNNYIERD